MARKTSETSDDYIPRRHTVADRSPSTFGRRQRSSSVDEAAMPVIDPQDGINRRRTSMNAVRSTFTVNLLSASASFSRLPSTRRHRQHAHKMSSENAGSVDEEPANRPNIPGRSMVTHLPDVVVFADHGRKLPNQKNLLGVLLFLDISGFTALCEKYSMAGKTGTDQLTKTLNGYMNALVSEILSYDGDILKFAGDAILSIWQVGVISSASTVCTNNMRSSLVLGLPSRYWLVLDGHPLK